MTGTEGILRLEGVRSASLSCHRSVKRDPRESDARTAQARGRVLPGMPRPRLVCGRPRLVREITRQMRQRGGEGRRCAGRTPGSAQRTEDANPTAPGYVDLPVRDTNS